jgi:outer membrane protein OmpA-like peptidoglycan-associated protein
MKLNFVIILCTALGFYAHAQFKLDTNFCDCNQSSLVRIKGSFKIDNTSSPSGHGSVQEISEYKQGTKFSFNKEHNSSWYKLNMGKRGHLCFTITPLNSKDDYDFMLFKAGKENFCDSLLMNKIKPIRACISRNRMELESQTGMASKAKDKFVKEGIGEAFVAPLLVDSGDVYYLVLDNVYDKGQGHSIQFYFEEPVSIKGNITDEANLPTIADIALISQKGDTIALSKSNIDGSYVIETFMRPRVNYVLNFYNDSSFNFSKNITLKDTLKLKNITTILPKLRKGAKRPIGNINFKGGLPEYLSSAIPSMNNLYKLLVKNPDLCIQIEGHTNGCYSGWERVYDSQTLSEKRAEKIKEFLMKKGISSQRIKTIGKGCKEIYPLDKNITEEQQELNRRVEILVLEF